MTETLVTAEGCSARRLWFASTAKLIGFATVSNLSLI
jgi:hypothetical protein